jgi:hypothetical protein
MNDETEFLNLLTSEKIKIILICFDLFIFILTNALIVYIFSRFFIPSNLNYFLIFITGTIISLFLIKTNYVYILSGRHYNKQDNKKVLTLLDKVRKKVGLINSIILLLKNIFFNILNDLFILSILWGFIFGVLFIFNLVSLSSNFNNFATAITIIGVFSGLYQFYIKNYKEKIFSDIINMLSRYVTNATKRITFNDFLESIKDSEKKNEINEIVKSKIECIAKTKGFRDNRLIIFNMPISISDRSIFYNIEYIIKEKQSKRLTYSDLNNLYREYFNEKYISFKREIDSQDFTETKQILLSSFIFLDEILNSIWKLNSDFSLKIDDPKGFDENYIHFTNKCIRYILYKILDS